MHITDYNLLIFWNSNCLLTMLLLWNLQAVQDEGGFEVVTREKKWPKMAVRLCYQSSKNIGSTLRQHYEKTLYPFDLSMARATADSKVA